MDRSRLEVLARRYGIVLLLDFGSAVSGRMHARSDVDLAVLLERAPLGLDEHAALLHDLQALHPGREVDLAVINHADPLFLKQVTQGCRLAYGSERRLQALKLNAFKRYQDHRRYLALERDYVRRALRTLAPA